mgnify:CR=1 FL=1
MDLGVHPRKNIQNAFRDENKTFRARIASKCHRLFLMVALRLLIQAQYQEMYYKK